MVESCGGRKRRKSAGLEAMMRMVGARRALEREEMVLCRPFLVGCRGGIGGGAWVRGSRVLFD